MPTLMLALEEGFKDDHVIVTAAGRTLADETGVSTRYQISLARKLALSLDGSETALTVRLPARGIEKTVPLASVAAGLRASVSRDGRALLIQEGRTDYA